MKIKETLWKSKQANRIRGFPGYIGTRAGGRTQKLERAMVSFGAEESFERASMQMKEHYGLEVGVSSVRDVTLKHAEKITQAEEKKPKVRTLSGKGEDLIVSEMDGSMIPMVEMEAKAGDKRKGRRPYWSEGRLGAAAECLGSDEKKQSAWFCQQKHRLKKGKIEAVMQSLKSLAKPDNAAQIAYDYLNARRNQLFYKEALAADLPIGSGMIESGHRHVIQKRLKLSGAWWLRENAWKMANLRVLRANGLWDSYWNAIPLLQAA